MRVARSALWSRMVFGSWCKWQAGTWVIFSFPFSDIEHQVNRFEWSWIRPKSTAKRHCEMCIANGVLSRPELRWRGPSRPDFTGQGGVGLDPQVVKSRGPQIKLSLTVTTLYHGVYELQHIQIEPCAASQQRASQPIL